MAAAHRKTWAVAEKKLDQQAEARSCVRQVKAFRTSLDDMGELLKNFQTQGVMAVFAVQRFLWYNVELVWRS